MSKNYNRVPRNEVEILIAAGELSKVMPNCERYKGLTRKITETELVLHDLLKIRAKNAAEAVKLKGDKADDKLRLLAELAAKRLENFISGLVLEEVEFDLETT